MPTSGMPWIKLWNDFLDDPKVGRLTPGQQLLFVKLLLVAGECDAEGLLSNGDVSLTLDEIAWRLRFDAGLLSSHWQALEEAGLVETQDDGSLLIIKFAERQDRPQSDKRALWRARQQVKRRGLRPIVYTRDNGRCGYCGKHLSEDSYVLDHIIPPDKGGSSELDNLTTCCFSCNTRKGGRTPEDAGMPIIKSHSVNDQSVTGSSQPRHTPREEESREEQNRIDQEQTTSVVADSAQQALLDIGMEPLTAQNLASAHSEEHILGWIAASRERKRKVEKQAGWVRAMIMRGPPPAQPDNGIGDHE